MNRGWETRRCPGSNSTPVDIGPSRSAGVYRGFLKRGFDIFVVVLVSPVALIIVGGLALVIRCDGGPALYSQERIGRSGRPFRLWKLRSMVPNADAELAAHLASDPEARAEWAERQKLRHDPRITRIGRFIRKTSLDELPQLWNVLVGEMSLVGPRPMMRDQEVLYDGISYYYLRPGITGLWQTRARNQTSFASRVRFDTEYDERLSFGTDLALIVETAVVVFRGTGH